MKLDVTLITKLLLLLLVCLKIKTGSMIPNNQLGYDSQQNDNLGSRGLAISR
jgi:hypothetical protein